MRRLAIALILVILGMLVFVKGETFAQPETGEDRTLSPYFFVQSDNPDLDPLPLKSTSVQVNISGVIADVRVTQVYRNEGKKPIEAIYIFPASTRAAVYGMKMTVGERIIVAKIAKREEARREYDDAKQAGKSASLLEQQRPNVFQMNVANILPGDTINVELSYTELLVPADAVYAFIYPTVVGPRYSNQSSSAAAPSERWIENPYFHQGEPPANLFDIALTLSAGLPIQEVACTSHKVTVRYQGPSLSSVSLDPSEKHGGNRDFIMKYRLAGGSIQTGLLLSQGESENFFLLMLQPPKKVSDAEIPPREYLFVVDVSGSMHGFPLDISKKLLRDLVSHLRSVDVFNVLLFSGGSSLMSEKSLPATPDNIQQAVSMIDRQRGGGGTELLPALQRALSLPRTDGYSRSVIIATDGYVTVEEKVFDLIRSNLGKANLFPFGIGTAVNRHLVEGMARVGMGEPFVITKPQEAAEKAKSFRQLLHSPLLTGVKIDFGGFQAYDVEPPQIPDLFADRPLTVFGKWQGKPQGVIRVQGLSGEKPFRATVDVSDGKPIRSNSSLRYLWARHRIALLSDYNYLSLRDSRVKEVTELGLTYNLLTAYTSFIAVDTQVRLTDGQTITVQQPLPLPQGVSDLAVGGGTHAQKASAPGPWAGSRAMMSADKSAAPKEENTPAAQNYPKDASLQIGKIELTDGLEKKTLLRIIEKHLADLHGCLAFAKVQPPALKGETVFTLLVGPDGRVKKVKLQSTAWNDEACENCLIEKLKALVFPAPAGGKEVSVTVSFLLS